MNKVFKNNNEYYYIQKDSFIQYVSINFKFGSINDRIGGEAHLLEHIVGTYISQIIKNNGIVCQWDAFTNYQNTCFTFSFFKNEYANFKNKIIPALFSLTINDIRNILKKEIDIVKEEIEYYKTQYFSKLLELCMKHFFKEIKFDELGTSISLSKIDENILYKLYKENYKYDNCVIAWYGSEKSQTAKVLNKEIKVDKILSNVDFSKILEYNKKFVETCSSSRNNISVMCAYSVSNSYEYSFFIKMILDYYLSSENSFLWDSLRVNKGLVYNFGGGYIQFGNKAIIVLYVETQKRNKDSIINLINKNIKNFKITDKIIKKNFDNILFNSVYLLNEAQITQTMIKNIDLLFLMNTYLEKK